MGVARIDLRARVSRAQVLDALVEILGMPESRFVDAFSCGGTSLGLEVNWRARGFLTAINFSWPQDETGKWMPEVALAATFARRLCTDAVVANEGIAEAASLPRDFLLIKPDGSAFAADITSSGIFDNQDELLLRESPEHMLPVVGLSL